MLSGYSVWGEGSGPTEFVDAFDCATKQWILPANQPGGAWTTAPSILTSYDLWRVAINVGGKTKIVSQSKFAGSIYEWQNGVFTFKVNRSGYDATMAVYDSTRNRIVRFPDSDPTRRIFRLFDVANNYAETSATLSAALLSNGRNGVYVPAIDRILVVASKENSPGGTARILSIHPETFVQEEYAIAGTPPPDPLGTGDFSDGQGYLYGRFNYAPDLRLVIYAPEVNLPVYVFRVPA
jgi:hypothetical protein